ncbi:MAG: diguanylate cyclase, partial [bacterium]|nr:diguanylate cyclase [bacterium]
AEWGRFGAKPLDDDAPPGDLPASAMFLPLASGSKVLGVLSLQSTRPGTFGEREHALLEPIAEGLAMAIARSHFQHVSEDAHIERRVILDVARALARDPHLPHVLEELCRQAQQVVDSPDVWVAMADRDGEQLAIAHHVRAGRSLPVGEAEVSAARTQRVFRGGRPLICNTRQEIEAAGIGADECPQARSLAIVPLRAGTKTVGAMHCCSPREHAYPASRADLLVAIGEQAGIAVTNARMYEDAAERSNRDPLTELLTHRAIMLGLQRLLTEQRAGVAAILLDIEAFRLFNTTFGHHIGDEALRLMTRCIRSAMGERDLAARYGGDEFLVVLAHGGAPAAHAFLERLREELLRTPLDSPGGVPIPISFSSGVAAAPEDGTSREALVAAADDRLQAERAGVLPQLTPATGRNCPALTPVQDGLLVAILRKDLYTRAHIHYVGEMAMDFAAALSLDAQTTHALFLATLLHDVGKICIPDAIISKPSTLTPSERKVMQRHTMLGYELVRGIDGMEIASLAVLHHHERIDGHGYPFGLAGNAIPEIARMVTIIDAFSAMVLDRPYHKAISDDAAKAELRRCAGTQFDAAYVEAFCRLLEG